MKARYHRLFGFLDKGLVACVAGISAISILSSDAGSVDLGNVADVFPGIICVAEISGKNFTVLWKNGVRPNPVSPLPNKIYSHAILFYSEQSDKTNGKVSTKSALVVEKGYVEIPLRRDGEIVFVKVRLIELIDSIRKNEIISGETD